MTAELYIGALLTAQAWQIRATSEGERQAASLALDATKAALMQHIEGLERQVARMPRPMGGLSAEIKTYLAAQGQATTAQIADAISPKGAPVSRQNAHLALLRLERDGVARRMGGGVWAWVGSQT